jgi:AAA domain
MSMSAVVVELDQSRQPAASSASRAKLLALGRRFGLWSEPELTARINALSDEEVNDALFEVSKGEPGRVALLDDRIGIEEPQVERIGLGYKVVYENSGVTMKVNRIREHSGEVGGQLDIRVGNEDLYLARVNFSSGPTRKSTAELLNKRMKGDWLSMLEPLCRAVLRGERDEAVVQSLSERRLRESVQYRLFPVLQQNKATILFGPGGNFKSTVGNAIAVAVQANLEVIPGWKPSQANVLVLDWEDDADTWRERTADIAAGVGVPAPRILHRQMLRPLDDDIEAVAALISQHNIGLVIVDSAGMAIGTMGEAGWHEGALRLFAALRLLRTTSLLIDHVAGAELDTGAPSAKPFGSVYKMNLARSVFELRKEHGNGTKAELLLKHTKVNATRKLNDMGIVIELSPGVIRFKRIEPQAMESPELVGRLSLPDRMAHLLRDLPRSRADIGKELGARSDAIRLALYRDQGKRFIEANGVVRLVTPGAVS